MLRKRLVALRNPLRQGFSLVEVIFACSLLAMVMLMMFNLYPTSLLTIRQAEHRLQAGALAQSVLEGYRAASFTAVPTTLVTNAFEPVSGAAPAGTWYSYWIANAGISPVGSPSYGTDGVQYWTEASGSPTPNPAASGTTEVVDLKVTCYWDERSDHVAGWDNTSTGSYHNWHHLTQELYILDLQR